MITTYECCLLHLMFSDYKQSSSTAGHMRLWSIERCWCMETVAVLQCLSACEREQMLCSDHDA